MGKGAGISGLACALVALGAPAHAASALVDLADAQILESGDASTPIPSGPAVGLLLVELVRERIAAHALELDASVPVLRVRGDAGPAITASQLSVSELLQLLILTDSRTAARSLLAAAGPGEADGRARLRRTAYRLGLARTQIADDWPRGAVGGGPAGRTTATELARLATLLARRHDVRRRLALDGVPIAYGATIVRAAAPLVALHPPSGIAPPATAASVLPPAETALALATRDGLELLAVASGPTAREDVWRVLERGFARYMRVRLVEAGQRVGRKVRVRGGLTRGFNAVAGQSFALTVRRGRPPAIRVILQLPSLVDAPVEANQRVGELAFAEGNRVLGALPLVAPQAIAPSRWLDTARR